MNADIFKALKPGGLYVVIDHQAAPGAANSVVETLHRIEAPSFARRSRPPASSSTARAPLSPTRPTITA